MKVDTSQQLLEFQLMSQMLKSASGDNDNTFSMVMSTLLKAMDSSGTGLSGTDLSSLTLGKNTSLNSLKQDITTNVKSGNVTIDQAVDAAAKKYNVDKKLIMAVINQESSFDPNSVSNAGAEGLMQLMPETAKELGVSNSFDIGQNVDGGTKYLKSLLNIYGNSKEMALAAYNAGPGAVQNRGMHNPSDVYKMPGETQDYVAKIMKNYDKMA